MRLKNNIMNLDLENSMTISIDKFQLEAEALKIRLTKEEIVKLVALFEVKEKFN